MADQQQQIQIKASDAMLQGVYSNLMQVQHTREEFVLDFMNMYPPAGTLNARVIVSPGHLKRMVSALTENLKRYEDSYGKVEASEAPSTEVGFHA